MAASDDQRQHFADPHTLVKKKYGGGVISLNRCNICLSSLSGLVGYRCSECDFDIHEECANHFQETITSFAHPWHTLRLERVPGGSGIFATQAACDLCFERGSFMYRCTDCGFDVHPLCTMLPQAIRSPLHPQHDLQMTPSRGSCSSCQKDANIWQYVCFRPPCKVRLHIACASGTGRRGSDRIAKFLIKTSFRVAVNAATGGMGSPVLDVLAGILN